MDGSNKNDDFESDIFQVKDTAALISIKVTNGELSNELLKNNGNWTLNSKYAVDNNLTKILTTILAQVQVKRPVARLNNQEVFKNLLQNGKKINISLAGGSEITFISGGNNAKTASYFADVATAQVYIVEIPGYNNYLSGIFELTENQWRDRILFSSSWRTIKTLNIQYQNEAILQIDFEDRFLKIQGVSKMDTTSLLTYLQQYEYFQINDYLELGSYPKYDSLLLTSPIATLLISDIDNSKNRAIKVFPKMKGERFFLLSDSSNQMMVVDEKRMNSLLVTSNQFKSE